MAEARITVTVDTRFATAFIRLVSFIAPAVAPIVGPQRLLDATAAVALRLLRYRFTA